MTTPLSPRALSIIHHAVLNSNDPDLIRKYSDELAEAARRYLHMVKRDQPEGEPVTYELGSNSHIMKIFGEKGLLNRRGWLAERQEIFSQSDYHEGGLIINLTSLARRVPQKLAMENFSYDWRKTLGDRAAPGGDVERAIKNAFKGTVGNPSVEGGFAIILDKSAMPQIADDIFVYRPFYARTSADVGDISFYRDSGLWQPETIQVKNIPKDEIPRHIRNIINLTRKIEPLGIDPDSVVLVRPEYNKMAAHILAEVCNFHGASHYLLSCAKNR